MERVLAPTGTVAAEPRVTGAAVGWALVLAGFALVPALLQANDYWLDVIFQTFLFAALALSWNIIGGYGGQMSFAHAVFFGVGAYTTALLYLKLGWTPWLTMWLGGVLAAIISFVVSWPTFRLRGPFFAIATMALNEIALSLVLYFKDFTGGPQSLLIPFKPSLLNMLFVSRLPYDYIALGYLLLALAVAAWIAHGKLGYQLIAVRENDEAARILGVRLTRVKLTGMVISAFLTALGGSLFAMYLQVIDATSMFSLMNIGAQMALITLIGGLGTLSGPIVGAVVITPLSLYLRSSLGGMRPGLHLIVFSTILILAALFFRNGLVGAWAGMRRRLRGHRGDG